MPTIRISGSVGVGGRNNAADVRLVTALLNVYRRQNNQAAIPVVDQVKEQLNVAISDFQRVRLNSARPDGRVDPGGRTFSTLSTILSNVFTPEPLVNPTIGTVTWEAEGQEGGRFHSRKLHVPSASSGLTLGRGYDMKTKTKGQVRADFMVAGIDKTKTEVLVNAVTLQGNRADQFIVDNDLLDFEITPLAQLKLFEISYELEASEVRRISGKSDVVNLYGQLDWDTTHQAIKDILVDLKFRGDYTGAARRFIQAPAVNNNLVEFRDLIRDRGRWQNVPQDRFNRRVRFLANAR